MSDIARLCIMCAVSSVCVTLTVCAAIGNLWEALKKLSHWTICQIRDEVNQDDER